MLKQMAGIIPSRAVWLVTGYCDGIYNSGWDDEFPPWYDCENTSLLDSYTWKDSWLGKEFEYPAPTGWDSP